MQIYKDTFNMRQQNITKKTKTQIKSLIKINVTTNKGNCQNEI